MKLAEWKDYWQRRCVKAEMMLIELQAFIDNSDAPQILSDKITGYFNEVAKGERSKYASPLPQSESAK